MGCIDVSGSNLTHSGDVWDVTYACKAAGAAAFEFFGATPAGPTFVSSHGVKQPITVVDGFSVTCAGEGMVLTPTPTATSTPAFEGQYSLEMSSDAFRGSVVTGDTFVVSVGVFADGAVGPYQSVQWSVGYEPSLVAYVDVAPHVGAPAQCTSTNDNHVRTLLGCFHFGGNNISYSGDAWDVTYRCVNPGPALFEFLGLTPIATTFVSLHGNQHLPIEVVDGFDVMCLAPTATPTSTPTPTRTSVPTATNTPAPEHTAHATKTARVTRTAVPTATATPVPARTVRATKTAPATRTSVPTATDTPQPERECMTPGEKLSTALEMLRHYGKRRDHPGYGDDADVNGDGATHSRDLRELLKAPVCRQPHWDRRHRHFWWF